MDPRERRGEASVGLSRLKDTVRSALSSDKEGGSKIPGLGSRSDPVGRVSFDPLGGCPTSCLLPSVSSSHDDNDYGYKKQKK